MSTKVLVFESDPAFAGELRTELGKLGCNTTVVEDGNVGLQQASSDKPDLILLSIELPRMNGFSVCNKLKKDAALKDVPLIIMSSESSDETFEQHKKLRTRAEDYVHKPIAFGELLQHIQGFVQIGADPSSEGEASIVIDEEIDAGDYLVEEDAAPEGATTAEKPKEVDADVEEFADAAFGRLTEETPVAAAGVVAAASGGANGAVEARSARKSVAPAQARTSVRPSPAGGVMAVPAAVGVDPGEHERVVGELGRSKERAAAVETELSQAKREIEKLKLDLGESEHLAREVEELKTKIASGAKGGGVSSREFLDLREGLNRKDKEILALKEQTSKKDKEIVETQEKMLALERSKADLDDKLLELEREIDEAKEKAEGIASEGARAKKAADDLKAQLEKAHAEGEAKDVALADLKAKAAADVAALEAKAGEARADADETLAKERAEHLKALDGAEAKRQADLEQASRDHDAALVEASETATRERGAAVDARAAEVAKEYGEKIRALETSAAEGLESARSALEGQIEKVRADASEAARQTSQRHAEELAAARKDGEDRLALATRNATEQEKATIEGLRAEHTEKVSAIENDRDARIATIESKATRELGEANDRLAKLEVDFSGVRGELESLRETKKTDDETYANKLGDLERRLAETSAAKAALEVTLGDREGKLASETSRADKAQAKWDADKGSLDRAKDALAVALAQIEEAEGRST
jgi:DNA-binding response OmpR family regulator/chromosome segregation ATPase